MTPSSFSELLLVQEPGSWVDWFLGLRELHWSDPLVGLGFEHALPTWVWGLIVLVAALWSGWSYHRLLGPRSPRIMLAAARAVTLVLIAVLLAGPTLVLPQETVQEDYLLVLVDRSASMRVRDLVDAHTGELVSRDTRVRRALREQADVFSQDGLGKNRQVIWLGFGATAYPINSPTDGPDLPEPDAQTTAIRTAIEQALRLPGGKPISAVVLITDGQTPQDTGQSLVQHLQQQGTAVFTVPVGSSKPPLDLSIASVNSPPLAFINDTAPISVKVEQIGPDTINPDHIRVTLTDEASGRVLDEKTLDQALPGRPLRLAGKSSQVGTARWRIRVEYKPPAGQPSLRELVVENNTRVVEVRVIDRPIRVLYIEGYPRWEFRYLKNLLIREKSISASTYLISADRTFAQEGNVPITRLPDDAQEMNGYDVVILGDVPAGFFSAKQRVLLRDHVSAGGAGLIWIGGERSTPRDYAGTPLADLLPMRSPSDVVRAGTAFDRFQLEPTALARELSVLELRGPGQDVLAGDSWPKDLPDLRWAQDLGRLKPTAEVLANLHLIGADASAFPVVVRLRYGAGQALYVGTDEAWRWRYGRGELYFEQYWVQWVRMLGRTRAQTDADRARLSVSQRLVQTDQAVVVELVLSDPSLISRGPQHIEVSTRRASDPGSDPVEVFELLPIQAPVESQAGAPRDNRYRAVWQPSVPGTWALTVSDPLFEGLGLTETVRVEAPDDEMHNPRSDHTRLATLAKQTGGAVVPLNELNRLLALVPNRARITPTDIREPLWASALSLTVLLGLFFSEWVIRRMIHLA